MSAHSLRLPGERLALFSDAVIAITITLLVLEIRLPSDAGELGDAELWATLAQMSPEFLAYLISFAVIGLYWLNHYIKLSYIKEVDRGLLAINLLFLLFVGIVPFTTALISENPSSVGTSLYAAGMVCCGLSLMWLWVYADRRGMIDDSADRAQRRRLMMSTMLSSIVFALSIPIAFIQPDVAKFLWLLIVPVGLIARPLLARGKP